MMRARPSFRAAVGWSYAMDGGRQLITGLMGLVLAGLLGPEAFGVVAMALAYILFVELLLKQGMGAAVIQRQDLRAAHLDCAFWLVMGSALVLMLVSVALSGWWATVNHTPALGPVIVGLTPMIPFQGLIVVQEAHLRRQFRFRSLAVRNTVSALLGGTLGIVLALAGFGVWSLVAQQVSTVVIATLVLWTVSDWRPRLRFHGREARELLGFSSGSFLGSLGVYAHNRGDVLVIGLLFGPLVVGAYRLASRLIELVIGVTVQALQSVALPDLSRVQDDPARFARHVLRFMSLSAIAAVPLLGVLAGSADAVLSLVGTEWTVAVHALQLLCLAAVAQGLFAWVGPMLQALGRPFQQALLSWGVAGSSIVGFVLAGLVLQGAPLGVELAGLALSRVVVYCGIFGVILPLVVARVTGLTIADLARAVGPALVAGLVAAGVGFLAVEALGTTGWPVWLTPAVTAALSACAAVVVLWLSDGSFRAVLRSSARAMMAFRKSGSAHTGAGLATTAIPAPAAAGDAGAARMSEDGERAQGFLNGEDSSVHGQSAE